MARRICCMHSAGQTLKPWTARGLGRLAQQLGAMLVGGGLGGAAAYAGGAGLLGTGAVRAGGGTAGAGWDVTASDG